MLTRVLRLASTFSDYTVGTAIVLTHLALAERRLLPAPVTTSDKTRSSLRPRAVRPTSPPTHRAF